ncbi:MAG: hypothetical protein ACM3P0_12460 [Acidobacteriota bacterium]
MRLKIYIPVLITAALSVLSGCYTVIEHPDVQAKDENGYTYNSKVYFYDDCASCHTDKEHQRQMVPSEHLSMFKAHDDTAYDNGYYQEDGYYSDQYYYPSQYYGDYGYYYNTPWWYTVTPPEDVTKTRGSNDRQAIQYNGRTRNQEGGRSSDTRNSDNNTRTPSVSSNSGGSYSGGSSSSSSTSSTNVQSGNNTNQNRGETRNTSDNKNSNEQPKSRNNEGGRSSNSGRR